jgi:hypothetical protein
MNKFSPVEIEVALYHYYNIESVRDPSPAVTKAIVKFIEEGILYYDKPCNYPDSIKLTKKGEKWVKLIINTPYPTQVWVDQNKNIIE